MSKEFYQGMGRSEVWPDLTHRSPTELTYSDVVIVPRAATEIESRGEVDMSVQFGPFTLRNPIMSAPMDTVTGEKMIIELARLGGIGTLPRASGTKLYEQLALCKQLANDNIPAVYSVGHKNGLEEAKLYRDNGAQIVLVDVAHGGMDSVVRTAVSIKEKLGLTVIAGNIVTYEQALNYKENGIDIARVGVGPGAVCKTREVAGTGFPQLSAVMETSAAGMYVIADGGIKYSGDIAKALAAGAKMVMIGTMFAGTDESPGDIIINEDGSRSKIVRGQASQEYMKDHNVPTTARRAAEGILANVNYVGTLESVVNDLTGGIASAMSYQGARNLEEFERLARFSFVSGAADREGHPHVNQK